MYWKKHALDNIGSSDYTSIWALSGMRSEAREKQASALQLDGNKHVGRALEGPETPHHVCRAYVWKPIKRECGQLVRKFQISHSLFPNIF